MELVMVIGLLGIMTVAAIPAIVNTQSVYLDGATRQVEADLRYAQNLATTTGDAHGFRTTAAVDGSITGYEVYNDVTDEVVESPYDHMPMIQNLSDDFSGVSFNGATNVIFNDVGTPSFSSGDGQLTMTNDEGETRDVIVTSTGLINAQASD